MSCFSENKYRLLLESSFQCKAKTAANVSLFLIKSNFSSHFFLQTSTTSSFVSADDIFYVDNEVLPIMRGKK